MTLKPPTMLLNIMGVWASVTGVMGFLANGAAIGLFCRSKKVEEMECYSIRYNL